MSDGFMRWLLDLDAIPAGSENLRLVWERPVPGWMWALAVVMCIALAVWGYGRLAGPVWMRGVLAGARSLIVLLVLIVISGPMLELPRETIEQDWVVVLADRSESMSISDVGDGASRVSRDVSLKGVLQDSGDMFDLMAGQRHLVWMGFHGGAFDLSSRTGGDEAPPGVDVPVVDLGPADGSRTNLNSALEQALQRAAARPLSGIVVMSDGRTADPPTRALIRRLQADAVQVFSVPLGSAEPVGDMAIRQVEAPRRAFVRDKVPVIVHMDQFGAGETSEAMRVRLIDDFSGEELDAVDLTTADSIDRVTLTAEPALAGEASWSVVIETAGGDLIPDNNTKTFQIDLVDRPLRVLFVEGYPRWEYRYLKDLLVREESIDSSVMLISADRDFAQEGNQPITRMPRSPEEFAEFDVIVLGDVPAQFFSPDQLEMMREHVAERGAGMLWMGGERSLPRTYAGTTLVDLLPMRGSLALPAIGAPVTMRPTLLADRLGVLRLALQDEIGWPVALADKAYGWSQLYYAQRIEPGRLKPTAEVLAETVDPFNGSHLPLVMHMRYGAGRTIYVATDETWRWRYGRGDHLPEQFWLQMLRMLGRESLTTSSDPATLEVLPRRVRVDQPMRIEMQILDARLAGDGRETVAVVLETADGKRLADLELHRDQLADQRGGGERFGTTYLPQVTGMLRVRVDDPTLHDVRLTADVEVFTPDDEMRRPETDHDLLASLAEETGGKVLEASRLNELPSLLRNRSVRTLNPLTERIWDTPLVFLVLIGLLTLEWVGRKMIRLA